MKNFNLNTARCAAEIVVTYPVTSSNASEIVGDYMQCGPIDGVRSDKLYEAVLQASILKESGMTGWKDLVSSLCFK